MKTCLALGGGPHIIWEPLLLGLLLPLMLRVVRLQSTAVANKGGILKRVPSKLPAPPIPPELQTEDVVGAETVSSRPPSSGADLALDSDGDGGAINTLEGADSGTELGLRVDRDSTVGESRLEALTAGFWRTRRRSPPSEAQLDFFIFRWVNRFLL